MTKPQLEKWMFGLFFDLALPRSRDFLESRSPLHLPANLSRYISVLVNLHEIGYPSHWLSTILSAILENKVITTARLHQSCPLDINELEKRHPPVCIDAAPFQADISTVVTMYQRIIPFGLVSSYEYLLPSIEDIYEYKMCFGPMTNLMTVSNPVISIMFFNPKLTTFSHSMSCMDDVRNLISSNIYVGDQDQMNPQRKLVHEGLQIVSTLSLSQNEKKATFWMNQKRVDEFVQDDWFCALWRTDTYMAQSLPIAVQEAVKKERKWVNVMREGYIPEARQ